ncbi:MAG: ABC transporter permease [Candidatus Eisenbacteria sp.]|nr:ABC transporter permease [Candidatus Eisenbacteria bacterium]
MNRHELLDAIRTAWSSIASHKLRSFLTTLGIVVGVGTVIAIVSIIHGLNTSMARQVESLGSDVVFVRAAQPEDGRPGSTERVRKLTLRHARMIQRACPHVARVAPFRRTLERVAFEGRKTGHIRLLGVTPDYAEVSQYHVDRGRFLTDLDLDGGRQVCVLGETVERSLFRNRSGVGEHVTIEGRRFLVVGVLEKKGRFITNDLDEIALIPLRTLEKMKGTQESIGINVMPVTTESQGLAVDEIRHLLRRLRGIDEDDDEDFEIMTQASLMETYHSITRIGYMVIRVVASISLLVGGIGIMNIMLVTVAERTREIGIRKALGARSRDVLLQFLVEAVGLSLVGGILGTGLGVLAGGLVRLASPLPAAVPPWALGLAFGTCSAVGLFFGVYPAVRAARMNPIEALRYE